MKSSWSGVAWIAFALVGLALLPRLSGRGSPLSVGAEAPDFHLPVVANETALADLAASSISLHALRGRPVLLVFWATWCGPCRAEAPVVERVSRQWRDQNVVVLGIGTDAVGEGDPGAFARSRGLSYPILRDADGQASRGYTVEGLPTLVAVSPAGKIAAVRLGESSEEEMNALIRAAL